MQKRCYIAPLQHIDKCSLTWMSVTVAACHCISWDQIMFLCLATQYETSTVDKQNDHKVSIS